MTMANKLTAVEWLVEQLKNQGSLHDLDIEAAKRMDYAQKEDAWAGGKRYERNENNYLNFNHYFNTNYKNINFNND
jgi:hypothetical protein